MEKMNGGVWVKASEELPDKFAKFYVRYDGNHDFVWFGDNQFFKWNDRSGRVSINVTEWLKPIKDVYVLTADELEKILGLAFTVGGAYDVQKYSGKDMMGLQNKKQFIESIKQ